MPSGIFWRVFFCYLWYRKGKESFSLVKEYQNHRMEQTKKSTGGNYILNNRLLSLQEKKSKLLKLKKSERGNELQETDSSISRIKRWIIQLNK